MALTSLPNEVLVKVVSHLGSMEDLSRASRVSKGFHKLVEEDSVGVWKEIAERKYGNRLTQRSIGFYDGDWKEMLHDDNRRGALLAVTPQQAWKGDYKYNQPNYYFCCLVTAIRYDRIREQLLVFIDARGEFDLRDPATSHLAVYGFDGVEARSVSHYRYTGLPNKSRRGHYKGVVEFPLSLNETFSRVDFCFASHPFGFLYDYHPITLFETSNPNHRSCIETALRTEMEGFHYTIRGVHGESVDHPFKNDTDETERKRWLEHVPQTIVDRTHPERWWV